ncbi:hydroxylamine reductase [Roseospira marina]|uniref:Hydroxylamine reductase n=1 Tax=Roseospira marina TaxID=140057 RepID=A0A5M6ICW6_9PROT|nr:hydroxylamine reductase [Roseospira marina]KAA5606120.1 hydroxylamine reductase [Roseospira marina]MBB4314258.1 hydroxylamine reductase [Roseospira marina]MBB5087418.1 hydroxylamine reductase [Roseospira marina]
MFCFQCEETASATGCTVKGTCGKPETTAVLQDLLIFAVRGLAWTAETLNDLAPGPEAATGRAAPHARLAEQAPFLREALFATITNVNWEDDRFRALITEALDRRDALAEAVRAAGGSMDAAPEAAVWRAPEATWLDTGAHVGVLATQDEDQRSLRELLLIGVKGIAAYAQHAAVLGRTDPQVDAFIREALASTCIALSREAMIELVLRAGSVAVSAMAVLDAANTDTYGHPTMTRVSTGAGDRPGILVSGHDLKDLADLLEQTAGTGIDVYTHGEMLPAHAYPSLARHRHLVGNYGGAWWQQTTEFESFHGAVLMTTNCLVPPRRANTYLSRLFTTGSVGYPGAVHIPDAPDGAAKDFSAVIERARQCPPPQALEGPDLSIGFAHNQVLSLADQVVEAVSSGAVRRFVVMAGCDGRHKARQYYTDLAAALPDDAIILTAGCAKYRYNSLDLGTIGGVPRLLDAGQCNDSYSLVKIALALKEALGVEDINDLPIAYDIAWYEQKAVAVLLALLSLGVKGIRLGPTLPAFLSPAVAETLVSTFDLKPMGTVSGDCAAIMADA